MSRSFTLGVKVQHNTSLILIMSSQKTSFGFMKSLKLPTNCPIDNCGLPVAPALSCCAEHIFHSHVYTGEAENRKIERDTNKRRIEERQRHTQAIEALRENLMVHQRKVEFLERCIQIAERHMEGVDTSTKSE
jgi:hypothetical protein